MHVRWFLAALASVILFSSGCEPFTSDNDEGKVTFINKSSHTVTVIPKAQPNGWNGFSFGPGETVRFNNAYDVFFVYEPRFRVNVGENSSGRILFIDASDLTVEAETSSN